MSEQDDERGKPQTLVVDKPRDGRMLDALVRELSGGSWNNAREMTGAARCASTARPSPRSRRASQRAGGRARPACPRLKRAELPAESILYVDGDVVVVNSRLA